MSDWIIYLPTLLALLGLAVMGAKFSWIKKQNSGEAKMQTIAHHIKEGAMAFLNAEYRILLIFVLVASLALAFISYIVPTTHWLIVPAFIVGAVFSAIAGNIGMRVATDANVRTAQAAKTSLPQALKVSFGGGMVMGLGVAGLAVFGLSFIFFCLLAYLGDSEGDFVSSMTMVLEALAGFSLGAESIALFARVGGGIYTKAADVGADLVGKVEAGIPEDDPRNPATIADNVGDNVGDVAGMGADLFGSYVATVLAAMVLGNYVIRDMGASAPTAFHGMGPILLPLFIAGFGIVFSIIGTFFVKIKSNDASENKVQMALNLGNWVSIILTAVVSLFLIKWMLPEVLQMNFFGLGIQEIPSIYVFYSVLIGLIVGFAISYFTEYYTALGKRPVLSIVEKSATGAATNIIAGLGVGMISTFAPIVLFAGAIWGAYSFAGFYGVSIAASAMMATTAMQLAIDAFGPIADNAGGIAEMSELPKEVRGRTDVLDSVGNTTAAIGKGFAIASAALTALALFAAYVTFTGIDGINIFKANVLAALFIGGMIPVVFSALAMNSVGKAAMEMVQEVRRQFREIPGIMEGTGTPEYGKCVDISTKSALKEMMLPGAIAIFTPILIGFLMGAESLGSYMAGVTVSGVIWAIFQNNAGGAWDNAKKSIEAGVEVAGVKHAKGTGEHKASVTGDTVGDPFKDTSGPSMNILIKLSCLVGLVIAPILGEQIKKENNLYEGKPIDNGAIILEEAPQEELIDADGNYIYQLGEITEIALPNNETLNEGINSTEKHLVDLLNGGEIDNAGLYKTWTTLDQIGFKTGSSELTEKSNKQIENLVKILNVYPDVKLKIGGYTDNVGSPENNLKLSQARAESLKNVLVAKGIAADRLEAEGYGEAHPICEANDTPACQAQNRRLDVRFTE
ncbi:sodium-translocating pyrophosphatase [Ornithobacterium rhinotracheale]|uniref:sodium-translocating pyrophosphatase n=1 Tax=Ornithobacterium rhinotracheale TaxID=28251 RepID=UPI0040355E32